MPHFLVATDFSAAAGRALAAAVQLAEPLQARITLLHAVELPPTAAAAPEVFVMKLLQAAKNQLQYLLREAAQHAWQTPIREILQVAPRRVALLAAIAQQQPDMVLIGATLGQGGRIGSTVDWLVRVALCPVLVMHTPFGPGPVRVVVFPTDFSALALHAGPMLRRLQVLFPVAVLHVLHVGTAGESPETLREQLALLVHQQGLAGCELAIVTAADLRTGVAQFVQSVRADVLVLRVGASGLGWLWPADNLTANAAPTWPPILTFRLQNEPVVDYSI
ncbi:universal stress protein [Hymenobacter sp. H14-R3]|uniref:universal stress protein n=1 Tax=Hymenobacter sp. H14-R3 TaxID=3046308 RepID=UPI0024BAEB0A|nr:universal stress protein [Hymenobacter sp. H14-R3]MDJ0367704.1 universal stress protein [Hymenobacter sp. H14-R3]